MELSVVVMAYDEVANLEAAVAELRSALAALGRSFEIVVVDDGSRDGTGAIADRLAAADPSVRAVHHPENRGLGGVYRTGFAEARGDLVTFFPADGQFPPSILSDFVRASQRADLVLGYVPNRRGRPLAARALSAAERLLYRALFGRLPRFQGILMFRRALLDGVRLSSEGRGWAVLLELVIRAVRSGCRTASVATPLRPRAAGASKVGNWKTIRSNLAQVLALRARL
jgi:dolichol-phosphate mannosyltransferase